MNCKSSATAHNPKWRHSPSHYTSTASSSSPLLLSAKTASAAKCSRLFAGATSACPLAGFLPLSSSGTSLALENWTRRNAGFSARNSGLAVKLAYGALSLNSGVAIASFATLLCAIFVTAIAALN